MVGAGLGRGRGGRRVWFLVVEAQPLHVVQDPRTVVVFRSIAHATAQFRRLFLRFIQFHSISVGFQLGIQRGGESSGSKVAR